MSLLHHPEDGDSSQPRAGYPIGPAQSWLLPAKMSSVRCSLQQIRDTAVPRCLVVVFLCLWFVGCQSSSPPTAAAGPNTQSTESEAQIPSVESIEYPPAWVVTVRVDGQPIVDTNLVTWIWGGLQSEPPPPDNPQGNVVVASDSAIELTTPFPAVLTVEWQMLDEASAFLPGIPQTDVASGSVVATPDVGLYALDITAEFPPSADDYPNSGFMRAVIWVQVVPPTAACVSDGAVSMPSFGVVDGEGCPTSDGPTLNIGSLLPSFHCAPWPPRLAWDNHPSSGATAFQRYPFEERGGGAEVIALPADAMPTGYWLPAGELALSASDPEAILVLRPDGTAERWLPPVTEMGCA